ncbi:MAG: amidohydrolase [Eubacteriales bacterium]|nr:amidohydrolase [Christensenellaceae bacterium]MEA5066783.1 amidohydrolase [Eubacteriales bacterium]
MIRIDNVALYTGERVFPDGCVLVNGDKIAYAGERALCPDAATERRIDGKGGILMPGFYNAHCHAAMVLMRGVGSDRVLMDWLHQIFPIEGKLTGDLVYHGAMLAIAEMIRRGVVAFADMYFFMDRVAEAALGVGMRANIVRGCTDRVGVEDNANNLYRRFNDAGDGLIKVFVGLHAEYTTSPDTARFAIETARKLGTGFHVHLSETRGEVEGCIERHGMTPPEYFDSLGAFDAHAIAAHCVHLTDLDVELLARKNVYAVHNPASNLKLASGIAPIARYLQSGMTVALGTDGASSNNCLDMLSDMRLASILQKGAFGDPTLLPAGQALTMATRTGARALGFDDCGLLREGYQADMVLISAEDANMLPCPDVPAALVYGAQGMNVRMTMVKGRVLYQDGAYTTLDIGRVRAQALEAARALGVI